MPVDVLAAEGSRLDAWADALRLIGATGVLLFLPTSMFLARAAYPGIPRYLPWLGLAFAVLWAADAVLTVRGFESPLWDLGFTIVEVGGLVAFTVVGIRVVRRLRSSGDPS